MTYFELKKYIEKAVLPVSADSCDYEAEEIVCYAAGIGSAELFMRYNDDVPQNVEEKCKEILNERLTGNPLEYITGTTTFFGLDLKVTPDVLIPRADTERVCEKALALLRQGGRFADICCGSGNIAAALLSRSDTRADLFDISQKAATVAKENIKNLGFEGRAEVFVRDVFSDDIFSGREKYDLIISNPPYIRTDVINTLSSEVKHEPHIALDGGDDGLVFYRRLLDICPDALNDGGYIVFEIGYDQKQDLERLCAEHGFDCEVLYDYGGNPRCCVVKV